MNICFHTLYSHFSGVQNLQGEFPQKVPADQAASVPGLLHQTVHKEQLLCGKEPYDCQLPNHASAVHVPHEIWIPVHCNRAMKHVLRVIMS